MGIKIGIDFHTINGIYQGSRSHVLELFSRVISMSPDMQFYLFLDKPCVLADYSSAFSLPNVQLIQMPNVNPLKRLLWQIPALQRKYGLDLMHSQYIAPPFSIAQNIVTIHDILFEEYPHYFTFLFRLRSKVLMRLSALRALHVFTVSEYSKQEIIKHYKINPNRVTVIHNGVDTTKYSPGLIGKDIIERRKLLPGGYLLSVGRLEPRKNYSTLIKAYSKLDHATLPLVIVGQRHYGYLEIFNLVKLYGLENKIFLLEDVSDDELPALYRHAKLFIYPTYAEGFGIPLLEAMASGLPIISTKTTSIPEVVGDACILVDPCSVNDLTNAMRRVLSNPDLAQSMIRKSLIRSASFQWESSANKVREVYNKLLKSK